MSEGIGSKPSVLKGDGSYGFRVVVAGNDLTVDDVYATWFGGIDDPGDDGQTASGVLNNQAGPQTPLGCALPIPGSPKTAGTPFPRLPWNIEVEVHCKDTGKGIVVPLIDVGPAKPPAAHAAIDLTQSAFMALGGHKPEGKIKVNYRVIGGAKYV